MAKFKGKAIKGSLRLGKAGRLTLTARFDELLDSRNGGLAITQRRLRIMRNRIAEDLILPFYKRLILRTPVWRGTARMNWKFAVGNKVAYGGISAKKNMVDPDLNPAANKTGFPAGATTYATPNTEKYGKTRILQGRELEVVKTQREFGKETDSVKMMISKAKRLIDEHYGPVDKSTIGKNKRAPKLQKIRIFNPLPYIRFLEGTGNLGRTYKKGSSIWKEKEGNPPFVAADNASGANPIGKYKAGYIGRSLSNLQGQFTKTLDRETRKLATSKRARFVGA